MEVSGLNSFFGFRPKGNVCWLEAVARPSRPRGGGGGGIPGMEAQLGGGGGGGGGTGAPETGGGGGGAGGNEDEPVEDKAWMVCDEGRTPGTAPNCKNKIRLRFYFNC